MAHLNMDSEALVKRVRRLIGQLQAIERALAEGGDCTTTLHLAAAARGAMGGLIDELIESHLKAHVAAPGLSDEDREESAQALIAAIRRYAK
ncbi:metal-sensing transcriptional repressor [Novosphingobium sp. SG720]|uniref:metal-sensing transcriptional repressor n=1 Tax=Novosphingobium sp. SG720 TaxID=2586998 RepID=UPI001445782D|nr:metal-sensing transcriptional repressor [Novosphingobium sp. SG720]NKJ44995.1 DNA-binding FrmR family transcriptional regulator [Novosphingobium sp. SG720]